MDNITHYPFLVFAISLIVLWLSAWIGRSFLRTQHKLDTDTHEDLGIILAATLTLLGLIIGFSFSMAIERYDQRKNFEEAEANAIGTEYVRADLLPVADAEKIRALLQNYLDQRILFYTAQHDRLLQQKINIRTTQLQNELWAAIQAPAAQPTPIVALAVSGMNDVLNSQGYAQAALWNRIPVAAWVLMMVIAICCNVLVGYGLRDTIREPNCCRFFH
ncbi:MAG: hypothetical protein R3F44_15375 [Candidatus Competibacteraceae bacterium]